MNEIRCNSYLFVLSYYSNAMRMVFSKEQRSQSDMEIKIGCQNHSSRIADYINLIFDTFLELHGDRRSGDDKTVIGGLARLDEHRVVVIGYERGGTAETPETLDTKGYRKSSRLMQLAEAFGKPVIFFIDVPISVSLSESEQQQQIDEAIAHSIEDMSCLMTPVIGIIAGESIGISAVDACAEDRVFMLENASCCMTSFDDDQLCLKAQDLQDLNVVNRIVKEPSADDPKSTADMREAILEELHQLTQVHPEALVKQRLHKLQFQFMNFGAGLPASD